MGGFHVAAVALIALFPGEASGKLECFSNSQMASHITATSCASDTAQVRGVCSGTSELGCDTSGSLQSLGLPSGCNRTATALQTCLNDAIPAADQATRFVHVECA